MKLLLPFFILLFVSCHPSDSVEEINQSDQIRINQLGYLPDAVKEFVVADMDATSFTLVNSKSRKVFKGNLADQGHRDMSGEQISMGDFSMFKKSGTYFILLNTGERSAPFEINPDLY